jgi:hypothetical protein
MTETHISLLNIGKGWLDVEPITPGLELELLHSGMEPLMLAELKTRGAGYCRTGDFFIPPADLGSSCCGAGCLGERNFMKFPRCRVCLRRISSNGYISAVQLGPDGTYKAVKYREMHEDDAT